MTGYNRICWYGNSHWVTNWHFICDCEKKYWFMDISFKSFMWKKNKNTDDATEEDRLEFKKIWDEKKSKFK